MSFGCSIGDFIQVTKLVKLTVSSLKSAPEDFNEAEQTVCSLDILLDNLTSEIEKPDSIFQRDPAQNEKFSSLIGLCVDSLRNLCDILNKTPSLGSPHVKFIDRFKFSRNTIVEIQRQLQLRYTNLVLYLNTIGLGRIGRIEQKVDGIERIETKVDGLSQQQEEILETVVRVVKEASARQETASVLSNHSNDDKSVWRQLRRDLNALGFKSSDIEKHKTIIFDKLIELQQSGLVDFSDPADLDDMSVSSVTYIGHPRNNYKPPTVETVYEGSDDEDDCAPNVWGNVPMGTVYEDDNEVPSRRARASRGTLYDGDSGNETNHKQSGASKPRIMVNDNLPTYQDTLGSPRTKPISIRTGLSASSKTGNNTAIPSSPQSTQSKSMPDRGQKSDGKYDYELRVGKRSTSRPVWLYRRSEDIKLPARQSADLGDGTLPKAASEGRLADVERLLKQGFNIESTGTRSVCENPNFEGTTALYRAAKSGHFDTVHLLLRNGANSNPCKLSGKSLLQSLVGDGSTEMLRLLLEYGADFKNQGLIPKAAFFGHFGITQILLNHGAEVDETDSCTALHWASSFGYSDIAKLLLDEGADTGVLVSKGESALSKSVQGGHYECTKLLLLYGARPNVGENGETPLYQACALGHEPTVRLLLRRRARPNTRQQRYAGPTRSTGSLPLDQLGPEASQQTGSNWASDDPLHAAALGGRLNIARLLLKYGAVVNAKNGAGQTAVDIAAEQKDLDMIKLLLDSGARGNEQTAALLNVKDDFNRGRAEDSRYKQDMLAPRRYSTSVAEYDDRLRRFSSSHAPRPQLGGDMARRSKSSNDYRRDMPSSRQRKNNSVKAGGIGATAGAAVALIFDNFDAFLI